MLVFYLSLIETEQEKSKFEIVYEEYRERMYFAAFDILQNQEDAEDAVHNAFVGIARNIKAVDDPLSSATLAYVMKAAKNAAINLQHKKQHIRMLPLSRAERMSDDAFIHALHIRERYDEVVSAIDMLDDAYRIPLYDYFVCEMKLKDIAALTGLSVSAVNMRIQRGKRELLQLLGVEENE